MGERPSDQPLRGTCLTMCPPAETRLRQRERLVHMLECRPQVMYHRDGSSSSTVTAQHTSNSHTSNTRESNTNNSNVDGTSSKRNKEDRARKSKEAPLQGDPQYFVKEFARSSAGREIQAVEVRPLPVLVRSLRYLLADVYGRHDCSPSSVHEFLSNRLRAVRQDLAVQGLLDNPAAGPLLAACARYYTLQQYRMCEQSLAEFDPFLNMKHLQEVLAGLVRIYHDHPPQDNKQQQFTFDYDDDEDEFLVLRDDNSDGDDDDEQESCEGGVASTTQECSDDTNGAGGGQRNASSPNDANLDTNVSQENADSVNSVTQTASTTTTTTTTTSTTTTNTSFAGRFGDETEEVSRVLRRIAGLDINTGEGAPDTASHLHKDKDEKNRFNKAHGEQVKENGEIPEEPVQWTNVNRNTLNHSSNVLNNHSISTVLPKSDNETLNEREEMECLYLLLNYDNSEVVQHALELPESVRCGNVLSKALTAVLSFHSSGNYVGMIRLLSTLPPTLSCCLYLSLPKLQKKVLQVLSAGHNSANSKYAMAELPTLLDVTKRVCQHYGLTVTDTQHIVFNKKDFKADAPLRALEKASWLDDQLAARTPQDLVLPHTLPRN